MKKKIFLTLTLLFSVSAFGSLFANNVDLGGGYTNSFDLSYDAQKKALSYLNLSPKTKDVLSYDADTQLTVVRVKHALRTFIAYMIEKKIYLTGEDLDDVDRSLGVALKQGDDAYMNWLIEFVTSDFHGLKNDSNAMPEAQKIHERWQDVFINSGILSKKLSQHKKDQLGEKIQQLQAELAKLQEEYAKIDA